eukprot:scaffold28851_cov56-Attheya_sp.AAC.3
MCGHEDSKTIAERSANGSIKPSNDCANCYYLVRSLALGLKVFVRPSVLFWVLALQRERRTYDNSY